MSQVNQILQSVLFDISQLLQVNQKPEQIFENVLKVTQQIIPFEWSTLYLFDNRSEQLEPVTNVGGEINLIGFLNFKLGSGISGWTAQIKRPINLGNVNGPETADKKIIRSFLSVPLLINERLVGVLNCGHSNKNAFEKSDLVKLQIIGSQIAGIIDNISSTIELMSKNIELEEMNDRLQETQEKLIETEKLAAIGQMAVRVSHEVNNPLAIIKGNLHLLKKDVEELTFDDEEKTKSIQENFDIIDSQITRIVDVIKKLIYLKQMKTEEYSADGVEMISLDSDYE